MRNTIEKEVNIDLDIEETTYNVSFNRVSKIVKENYGADADGNRGQTLTFVDEDYAENIYVDDVPINELPTDLQLKIEDAVETWVETNDVEE